MDDLISRQDAIERLKEHRRIYCKNHIEFTMLSDKDKSRVDEIDNCIATLTNLPSAQPEIIRCKDCKWYDLTDPCGTLTPNAHRCKRVARLWIEDDAYCSYGERRE